MRPGKVFRALGVLTGAAVMGYGLYGMLHDPFIRRPADILRWAVGGLVLHDFVWLPVVLLLGVAVARLLPQSVRGAVRNGLVVAAATTAVALPGMLRAHADHGGNTTVDALDYQRHWLWLIGAVALATIMTAVVPALRARRNSSGRAPRPTRSASH